MDKILPMIEKVILNSFPDVMDVRFEDRLTYLGSSYELPEEERTISVTRIVITINNLKDELKYMDLYELRKNILDKLNGYFNLDFYSYGSKWDTLFLIAKVEKLKL